MASELDKVLRDINKTYGEGTICLASKAKSLPVKRVPWGIFALDCEMGGGIPLGRIIQIHGAYSSGKTTLALHMARNIQGLAKSNKIVWVDAEGTFDLDWARTIGVDLDRFYICRPQTGEKGLDMAEELVKSKDCSLLVVDSIGNIAPMAELEKSMEEQQMGALARLINKFIRKVTMALQPEGLVEEKHRNDCIVLLLNQERETMNQYGPKVTTPGGRGKDFASSITIELRRSSTWITEGKGEEKKAVGQEIFFKISKNKTAPPLRTGMFDFYFDNTPLFSVGEIDNEKSVLLYAIRHNIIGRNGSFYTYDGKKWQGKEAAIDYLKCHQEDFKKIQERVLQIYAVTNITEIGDKNGKREKNAV